MIFYFAGILTAFLDTLTFSVVCKFLLHCSHVSSSSQMTSLEQVGEEVVGQARCPFESGQSNVGLFAGESTTALLILSVFSSVFCLLGNKNIHQCEK